MIRPTTFSMPVFHLEIGPSDIPARTGDTEWLIELLSAHKDLVAATDRNGNTPLHFASANGHNGITPPLSLHLIFLQCKPGSDHVLEIIKFLLKYPQSISPQNSAGNTPLHWACLNNHVDTVKLLVQEGADMFVKNGIGRDAVWEAEQRGNEELVNWMLGFGEEKITGQVTEEDVDELHQKEIDEGEGTNKPNRGDTDIHKS
jgi:uncharacterized protein